MSTIFIYSNSYVARTLAYNVQHLVNFHIDKLVLFKENHSEYENWDFINVTVELYDKLIECVKISDYVLIANEGALPVKTINLLQIMCEEYEKPCIGFNITSPIVNVQLNDLLDCYKDKPIIAHLYVGEFSQGLCGEMLLNKISMSRNLKSLQLFSYETLSIVSALKENNILNNKIVTKTDNEDFDIIVFSMYVSNDNKLYHDSLSLLSSIYPDFTIVQVNESCSSIDTICNILKYQTGNAVDIIIKSHYCCLQNGKSQYLFYKDTIDTVLPNIYDIESKELEKDVAFDIFSKMALPENISRII